MNDFTDEKTRGIYDEIIREAGVEIERWIEEANKLRASSNIEDITRAACIYLSLAQKGIEDEKINRTEAFHFAGHQFRRADQLKRAAQSYENAAICGYNKFVAEKSTIEFDTLSMAISSAGRAKNIYSEIAESEESDRAHVLQQDLKYRKNRSKLHLLLWRWFNLYGTSGKRWFIWFLSVTAFFTLLYCSFLWLQWINIPESPQNTKAVNPLYFTLTTVGYGDLLCTHWLAQLAVISNWALRYVLLGTGITFFTRK